MLQITPPLAPNASQQFKSSKQKAIYYGRDSQTGGFRFKDSDGQKCLVIGAAYEIVTTEDKNGKPKKKRELISKTPGWQATPDTDVSFIAIGSKSGKRVRLVGTVQLLTGTTSSIVPSSAVEVVDTQEVAAETAMLSRPASQATDSAQTSQSPLPEIDAGRDKPICKPLALTDTELSAFKSELEIINMQRASGLNPNVSIPTMEIMCQRSHASIYRDVKKSLLPKPTKVGSRSFFPLSVVLAYAAGQVCGGAA